MKRPLIVCFLILFALFSCDVSGDNTDIATEIQIAETVIYDFRQVRIEKGRPVYEIRAKRGETFTGEQVMKVFDARFKQYDKERKIITEGTATQADYHIDSEDATLIGPMDFRSNTEKVRLQSTWLNWESETKIVSGNDNDAVRLEKENGTHLRGKGFKAYTETKTVYFNNGMTGVFIPEKGSPSSETPAEGVGASETPAESAKDARP